MGAANTPFVAGAGRINIDLFFAGLARLPQLGQEEYAKEFSVQLGGGTPATMATLSRLGVPTKLATYWGSNDMFSAFAEKELAALGIHAENLHTGPGMPLAVTAVAVTGGERTFVSYADEQDFTDEVLQRMFEVCRGAKIVAMQREHLEMYRRLKEEGATLVLDLAWEEDLSLAKYEEYLRLADYCTPSRVEALKITGAATVDEAAVRLAEYFDKVVIKLDSEGCLVREEGHSFVVPPINEFVRVDSTGAGDAFWAGFMYGLYRDAPLRECVLYGNITGGKSVTKVGCLTAFVNEEELLEIAQGYRAAIE